MYCKHLLTRSFAGLFAVILISNAAVSGNRPVSGDVDEAIRTVMQMKDPIMNYKLAETERLALEAAEFARKAYSVEKDSDNKNRLENAIRMLGNLISEARKDNWQTALQYWTEIGKALGDVR